MSAQLSSIFLSVPATLLFGCATGSRERMLQERKAQLTVERIFRMVAGNTLHPEAINFNALVRFLDSGWISGRTSQDSRDVGTWDVNNSKRLCLKFDTWYYDDEYHFATVEIGTNVYSLFTANGVRAFIVVAIPGDPEKLAVAQPPRVISSMPSSPKEVHHTLAYMAKNCPKCSPSNVDLAGTVTEGVQLDGIVGMGWQL